MDDVTRIRHVLSLLWEDGPERYHHDARVRYTVDLCAQLLVGARAGTWPADQLARIADDEAARRRL